MEHRGIADLVDNVCFWIVVRNRSQKRELIFGDHLVHIGRHQWMHDDNKYRRGYVCRERWLPMVGDRNHDSFFMVVLIDPIANPGCGRRPVAMA
jgi:hypothetical protein